MADTNTRQANRAPVTLKIKFKSETLDQFIERYAVDISHGGIFIRTKDPLPVGTTLRFEFQLKDSTPLIGGEGTVVWTREHDPTQAGVAPGMGVRFDKLPAKSQRTLDKILAEKSSRAAARTKRKSLKDSPTVEAPSRLVADLAKESAPDPTLLGLGAASSATSPDDDERDVFEEATRVAPMQALAEQSAEDEFGNDEPTRQVSLAELEKHALASVESTAVAQKKPTPPPPPGPGFKDRALPTREDDTQEEDTLDNADTTTGVYTKVPMDEATVPSLSLPAGRPAPAVDELARRRQEKAERAQDSGAHNLDPSPFDISGISDQDEELGPESMAAATQPDSIATALKPAERPSGGSGPGIAVATFLLLAGGAAGWWFIIERDTEKSLKPATLTEPEPTADMATPTAPIAPAEVNPAVTPPSTTPTVPPPTGDSPPAALNAVVTSETAGAVASLVGTDQKGPTPMTFTGLSQDQVYKVRVSASGHVPQEVEIRGGSDTPVAAKLVAMTKLVRFGSAPQGADVIIDGKRRGVTPFELRLSDSMSNKRLRIAIVKRGFARFESQVLAKDLYEVEGDRLVHRIHTTLEKRVRRRRPSKPKEPPKDEPPKDEPPKDEPPKDEPPKDEPPKDEPPKDEPPKDEPPKDEPPKDEPPKDKPPKDEPPKDEPPVDKPSAPKTKPKPKSAPGDEPVPDFMKD